MVSCGTSLHCWQCCSCLFVFGRTVVYRSHYKRPQFPPEVGFGGPNYRLQRLMLLAHQDSVDGMTGRHYGALPLQMTTTALIAGLAPLRSFQIVLSNLYTVYHHLCKLLPGYLVTFELHSCT